MTSPKVSESPTDEARTIDALLAGDEEAFKALIDLHGGSMLRVALLYAQSRAVAEEIVQETWLSMLGALTGFERRSSLKTWLFTILVNCAKRRVERESRSAPFSSLSVDVDDDPDTESGEFFDASHPRWAHCWTTVVQTWEKIPGDGLLADELQSRLAAAVRTLPESQRLVFTLHDVEGLSADAICNTLELSGSNQRVLLHRARLKVRAELKQYLEETEA